MSDQHFPDDENGGVLRRLHSRGVDLTIPRNIDFAVAFDEQAQALAFRAAMERIGNPCVLHPPGVEMSGWDAIVTVAMVPTHVGITTMERRLATASQPLGGRTDGWGFLDQPAQILI